MRLSDHHRRLRGRLVDLKGDVTAAVARGERGVEVPVMMVNLVVMVMLLGDDWATLYYISNEGKEAPVFVRLPVKGVGGVWVRWLTVGIDR